MDEIVLQYFGAQNTTNELGTISTKFKRVNKTHQLLMGKVHVKKPFGDNYLVNLVVFTRGNGEWAHLVTANFSDPCTKFLAKSGYLRSFVEQYFPDIAKQDCPIQPGNYTVKTSAFPRYRKDWDPSFQALVPPAVPATGENFKAVFKAYDTDGKLVEEGYGQALFLSKFSANQG